MKIKIQPQKRKVFHGFELNSETYKKDTQAFIENNVEMEIDGGFNSIELYSNDWVSYYETRLNGKIPYLKLVGRERCYR